jgi:hypothetical protein
VSRLVRERGGYDLMPEQGCAPVNKYLPPRRVPELATAALPRVAGRFERALLRWIDRILT